MPSLPAASTCRATSAGSRAGNAFTCRHNKVIINKMRRLEDGRGGVGSVRRASAAVYATHVNLTPRYCLDTSDT